MKTGAQIVEEWRQAAARRGWIVDRDLPGFVFEPLATAIDDAILDAATKPETRAHIPEDGRRGGVATKSAR